MEKTVKLYDLDAYETEFDATVISCEELVDNAGIHYALILDQTLFFPMEGGQTPDRGSIEGIEVTDVRTDDGLIRHYIGERIKEGSSVHGRIDFKHRFYNMQQHSGEHIFSGLVHTRFGADNVGFHLSDNSVTMDFNKALTAEDIRLTEDLVNEAIVKNIEIRAEYPDEETLRNTEYRSKKEIDGPVRLVTIPGYDICACCAPHVRRTGEIGLLKVMDIAAFRGGVRVSILCGFRALDAFRKELSVTDGLVGILTTGKDKLIESVGRLKEENAALSLMEERAVIL